MEFIDTHCHIHSEDYSLDREAVIKAANKAAVKRLIAVGENLQDSQLAVAFADKHNNVWASVGIHPHEAKKFANNPKALENLAKLACEPKVVAIGETGLDYHYLHSAKEDQKKLLLFHIELAKKLNLPMIFHVREAYEDFWQILDEHSHGLKGVVHSFSSSQLDLENALKRGFFIGVNGIVTFTTNSGQLDAYKALPLERLMLETDAPFLTPTPYRGTICEPRHVVVTAQFLSQLLNQSLEKLAQITTQNAIDLFNLGE
jgi:TatD DNase family protein